MKFSAATLTAFLVAGQASSFSHIAAPAFIGNRVDPLESSISSALVTPLASQRWHTARCSCNACSRQFSGLRMSTVDETSSEPAVAEDSAAETPVEIAAPESSAATESVVEIAEPIAEVHAEPVVEVAEPIAEEVNDTAELDVPAEVQAMDGVNGETEAHNAERPARRSLKKKPKGLPLSDFKAGDTVKGKAKSVAAYGAFMDIGAETDGLLHISNLSTDFVSSVKDVIEVGQEYDVRILSIDMTKKQVALSLLTEEEEQESAAAARPPKREARPKNDGGGNNANRRDDAAILKQLQEKGWDEDQFVSGTVISTVDFGAFVRVDASQLNAEVSGEFDGLVHISALSSGRVRSVTDAVKVGETVQVRCKGIDDRKVSLSMVSTADEALAAEARGGSSDAASQDQGNKDWKEAMLKLQEGVPAFNNKPVVVNNRKD